MKNIGWKKVPSENGVYRIHDLDGKSVYVGQALSRGLRSRLREHFTQQNSSVVTQGRIDLLDTWYVDIWSIEDGKDVNEAERQLIESEDPIFNREEITGSEEVINPEMPDEKVYVCSDDEREMRMKPENRIRSKMDHLQRMIDSDGIAIRSLSRDSGRIERMEHAKEASGYHLSILRSAIDDYYSEDRL
jgi:hypothetical protein